MTVRHFDVTDEAVAARVVQLQRAAYAVEAKLIGFDGIPPLHDTVADVQAHKIVWVGAFQGDNLVGGLGYSDDGPVRDIDRLFVDPAEARRGIGRALVSSVLDHPELHVSTGAANHPARELYESLGFVAAGQREIAVGVTVTSFVHRKEDAPAP
ncbi:MAG: GNAT family N-acetyltransferase [Acidimicrobiia bacterium]|nr:GNAT family N-acetyltransferase [Acidimicrobiia bacterium]